MTPQVGDVVRIGRGETLWTVERHHEHSFPEVVVHLWDLTSHRSGRRLSLNLRADQPRLTLVWTLEEVVFGTDVLIDS